jgi:hypothetical protein
MRLSNMTVSGLARDTWAVIVLGAVGLRLRVFFIVA